MIFPSFFVTMLSEVVIMTQLLWWLTQGLLVSLVVLAIRGGFFSKYLSFYLYLIFLLGIGFLRMYAHAIGEDAYLICYWYTEFLLLAGSYCVLWEIGNQAFSQYPGAARMAKWVVGASFLVVAGVALLQLLAGGMEEVIPLVIPLERNLHTVQALMLLLLISVVAYYRIPIGRNLWGIILGYGLYLSADIITLTLWSYLDVPFQVLLQNLHQVINIVTLMIWLGTLWSYQPNPIPEVRVAFDYPVLVTRTTEAIAKARSYIVRVLSS